MELKLTKTYLSRKTSFKSFLVAALSLGILALFFGADKATLSASGYQVFQQQEYWRAFTTSLLHADLTHLAHNAFFFTGLALLLHNYFGFWVFPVLSFVAGGVINLLTLSFYPPTMTLVGVSGVVYFMASFWLTLYILIERRQRPLHRFLHALAVSLIFLFPEAYVQSTSYLAHGIGFLVGILAGGSYYAVCAKKLRAGDVWTEIHPVSEELTLLAENFSHPAQPEEAGPSVRVCDSARCPQH